MTSSKLAVLLQAQHLWNTSRRSSPTKHGKRLFETKEENKNNSSAELYHEREKYAAQPNQQSCRVARTTLIAGQYLDRGCKSVEYTYILWSTVS